MKPVNCSEIAVREVEGFVGAPQGSQRVWMRFRVVLLVVKGQRQLGVRRNLLGIPVFAVVNSEFLVWSLTSTEDCG